MALAAPAKSDSARTPVAINLVFIWFPPKAPSGHAQVERRYVSQLGRSGTVKLKVS
jgi:hypothetical protein